MKWFLCTIILLLALAACSQPTASTTPVLESTTAPTATLEETQDRATPTPPVSQSPAGVFDVYLVKQDISPQQMTNTNLTAVSYTHLTLPTILLV